MDTDLDYNQLNMKMKAFIEAIQMRPCLWKLSHKDYRTPEKKEAAWQSIVAMKLFGLKDIKQAKAEWKKLRDSHRDSLKRAKGSTVWKHTESMAFLVPYMKTRTRSSVFRNEDEDPQSPEEIDDDDDGEDIAMSNYLQQPIYLPPPAEESVLSDIAIERTENERKRKADSDIIELLTEMEHRHMKREEEKDARRELRPQPEKHSIDLFMESMAMTIKAMPTSMQTKVKRKIFAAVTEAEDELDNPAAIRSET